jgi:release factor glutamine methyltransferase
MMRSAGGWPRALLSEPSLTLRAALLSGTRRLRASGSDTPRLDAELLLAEALRTTRERLLLDGEDPLSAATAARFDALLQRRAAHEPVAYILGRRAFRRLELAVDRRVLIPRPESELLVEVALELPPGVRVADVGTGSGAIALAVADERPDLEVWGLDRSAEALEVARQNAERLALPVRFAQGDLLSNPPAAFHTVLANLPYVDPAAPLPPDVAAYEPHLALFAPEQGLALIRRLLAQLARVAVVALEVGEGQAAQVAALLRTAGFPEVQTRRDLAGIERVAIGRRG